MNELLTADVNAFRDATVLADNKIDQVQASLRSALATKVAEFAKLSAAERTQMLGDEKYVATYLSVVVMVEGAAGSEKLEDASQVMHDQLGGAVKQLLTEVNKMAAQDHVAITASEVEDDELEERKADGFVRDICADPTVIPSWSRSRAASLCGASEFPELVPDNCWQYPV